MPIMCSLVDYAVIRKENGWFGTDIGGYCVSGFVSRVGARVS